MSKGRKTLRRIVVVAAVSLAVVLLGGVSYSLRWEVWPKRFAQVEPGWLYRGGQVDARLIEDLADRYAFGGILSLTRLSADEPDEAAELALIEDRGLDFCMIPMPGNGVAAFEQLDQAADWIATHEGRPIYVHCAAGVKRTSAAIAAYRLKHCGWSLEQAAEEARRHGIRSRHRKWLDNLAAYQARLSPPARQQRLQP